MLYLYFRNLRIRVFSSSVPLPIPVAIPVVSTILWKIMVYSRFVTMSHSGLPLCRREL